MCGQKGEKFLSQNVKISAILVTDATGEHPSASHCDNSNYQSTGAELFSGK